MNRFKAFPFALALAIMLAVGIAPFSLPQAQAQQRVAADYSAVITSVDDSLNIFNGLLTPGMIVGGRYDYDPALLGTVIFGPFTTGHVANRPNDAHSTFTAGLLSLSSNFFNLVITNDEPGVGDDYDLTLQYDYPDSFAQLDPDLYYVSYPGLRFDLIDPSGTALSSLNAPLTVPSLGQFTSADGSLTVIVDDANTGDEFISTANFRLTSLTASVPEPGSLALLLGVGVSGGWLALRRRRERL